MEVVRQLFIDYFWGVGTSRLASTAMQTTLSPTTSPKVRRKTSARRPPHPPTQSHESHDATLNAIRSYLRSHTCYDALPISFRLIVLDTKLNVKKALQCLLLNGQASGSVVRRRRSSLVLGVVSAPLWNSEQSRFAGMLTVLDLIHLIQHYYRTASYDTAAADVETFKLEYLRGAFVIHTASDQANRSVDVEKGLGVAPPPLLHEHPSSSLYDASRLLIQTHARRLPLLDRDTETRHEVIVSVLTQYRLLKFIAINVGVPSTWGRP